MKKDMKMRELRLIDEFLENVNCIKLKSRDGNTCVVDCIRTVVKDKY